MSPVSPFSTRRPLYALVALGVVVVLGYGLFVATPYLLGPSLTLRSPQNGTTLTSPTITISGETERVSYLSINNLAVPLLEDGTFFVERAYPKGYTVLVVEARDRFGRTITDTVRFIHN